MKGCLAALLVAVSLPAWASGDPRSIFVGLIPLLVLAGTIVRVLVAKASWSRRWRGLVPAAAAMGVEIGLGFVPDYQRNAGWLVPLAIAVACAGAALAWRSLPHAASRR